MSDEPKEPEDIVGMFALLAALKCNRAIIALWMDHSTSRPDRRAAEEPGYPT